jgi:hypothetical protein
MALRRSHAVAHARFQFGFSDGFGEVRNRASGFGFAAELGGNAKVKSLKQKGKRNSGALSSGLSRRMFG